MVGGPAESAPCIGRTDKACPCTRCTVAATWRDEASPSAKCAVEMEFMRGRHECGHVLAVSTSVVLFLVLHHARWPDLLLTGPTVPFRPSQTVGKEYTCKTDD